MQEILRFAGSIAPLDRRCFEHAKAHLDQLTKPRNSLGRLEELAMQMVAIAGGNRPDVSKKGVFVFAADHGVASEGVSAYPAEVTAQMVYNFVKGGAAINVLARQHGAKVHIIDMGVNCDFGGQDIVHRKVRRGTSNIASGPAMTTDECVMAIRTGMDLARQAADEGYGLVAVGEMGIGNTTASSAVMGALLGLPADAVAGRGTGISDFGLGRKIEVIEQALAVNQQRLADPVSILAAVGGFEVAGIAGFVLGCAKSRLPVIIDGFISSVATAVAIELNVVVRDYCFFSHVSREKAHRCLLTKLRAEPLLDLGLCLGEGTGAVLAMALIESAVNLYNEMSTFGDAGVSGQAENLST